MLFCFIFPIINLYILYHAWSSSSKSHSLLNIADINRVKNHNNLEKIYNKIGLACVMYCRVAYWSFPVKSG